VKPDLGKNRGILGATSAGCLPRGRQQVSDARRKGKCKQDYMILSYAVMFMCKEGKDKNVKVLS